MDDVGLLDHLQLDVEEVIQFVEVQRREGRRAAAVPPVVVVVVGVVAAGAAAAALAVVGLDRRRSFDAADPRSSAVARPEPFQWAARRGNRLSTLHRPPRPTPLVADSHFSRPSAWPRRAVHRPGSVSRLRRPRPTACPPTHPPAPASVAMQGFWERGSGCVSTSPSRAADPTCHPLRREAESDRVRSEGHCSTEDRWRPSPAPAFGPADRGV